MGFFRRIGQIFSNSTKLEQVSEKPLLQELMEKARRAQYSENYDEALALLSQAMEIAESNNDVRTKVDITLSRGDILIVREDYETASFILNELREDSEARHLNAPLAYSLCSLGVLEQAQGNLTKAQELFETAREKADAIRTDGASGRAIAHLGDLSLLDGNASYAVYLLEDAIEKLNRSGDRELLGYFLGKLGLAQIQNGQKSQGEIRVQRGLDLAMNIQHKAQMRYLNNLLGQSALKDRDFQKAQKHFEETLKLYPEPTPETEHYVRLLCQLAQASLHNNQITNAKQYAEKALRLAEKLSSKKLIATAKGTMGLVLKASKDNSAIAYLTEAIDDYESTEIDSFYIQVLCGLAGAQIESGDIQTGVARYENAIDKAQDSPHEAGQIHNELAYHYAKSSDYRKAIEEWQKAISYFEQEHQSKEIALTQCHIASMYEQVGDGRMAQREYGKALEMLSQLDDLQTKGTILANIAGAYSNYGDVETAQDFFKESIQIAERKQDLEALAIRRSNFGRLLVLTNRPQKALVELQQAMEDSEKAGLDLQSALSIESIGLVYALNNDYETAEEHYQLALSCFAKLDAPHGEASLLANRGDSALSAGHPEKAEEYYKQAYSLAQANELVTILVQVTIGQVMLAIQKNDLDSANQKLSEIEPIASRLDHRRWLANLHQAWSLYHAKKGNIDKATSAWEEAKKIRQIMQMSPIEADWL